MRPILTPLSLGICLFLGLAPASSPASATSIASKMTPAPTNLSAAQETDAPARPLQAMPVQIGQRVPFVNLSATCETEMTPDEAVILGGVSTSALKPDDAISQLDKEIASMKSYVVEKHGQMEMLERVRTLKPPQPAGRAETEQPFQVVQRIQVTFPADAPVDSILEKLIELGLDRFGENVLNNFNRREVVIRFRISDFAAKFDNFEKKCTADAWTQACSTMNDKDICGKKVPPDLDLNFFNARSKESLMHAEGNTMPWQFNLGRGQHPPDPPDLLGKVTIHLEGNISLIYHREAVEKP